MGEGGGGADPHGEQRVLGPDGPGDFPPESSCVQSHHVHRQAPKDGVDVLKNTLSEAYISPYVGY